MSIKYRLNQRFCSSHFLGPVAKAAQGSSMRSKFVLFPSSGLLLKATYSTVAKRGSVFIGLMTPNGAIWPRYQRAVLMR